MCQYVAYAKLITLTDHRHSDGNAFSWASMIFLGLCDGSSWRCITTVRYIELV